MSRPRRSAPGTDDVHEVHRLLGRERLSVDEPRDGRTTFLSHLGAQGRLVPGPWIGHRDLLYALALANLTPPQRASLASAVMVDWGREFGVGQLLLEALPSGLPRGGSSLLLRQRKGGVRVLHTWGLGPGAATTPCDWLVLSACPEWALDPPPRPLVAAGLQRLVDIGGEVVVLVATATDACAVAEALGSELALAAHPRFAPHLRAHEPDAPIVLWPHDALDGAGLRRRSVVAVVLVAAPEAVRLAAEQWVAARVEAYERARSGLVREVVPTELDAAPLVREPELVEVGAPSRLDRAGMAAFWSGCGRPRVLLQGEPTWAHHAAAWLRTLGAEVELQADATQLSLL